MPLQQFTWYDRKGKQIATAGQPGPFTPNFDLSADGKQIAHSTNPTGSPASDLWVMDWTRGGLTSRFTYGATTGGTGRDVVWSPDGLRLAYSINADIVVKNASGLGAETALVNTSALEYVEDWSKDDRYIAYVNGNAPKVEIWALPLFGERKPVPVVQSQFVSDEPHFSFDTKWMAYNSNESRRHEIYVISFPEATQRRQISTSGGVQPRWRKDGKELYYLSLDGKMMAVDMTTTGKLDSGIPHVLFETGITAVDPTRDQYAVIPDGTQFLLLKPLGAAVQPPITVDVNWTRLLKR